MNLKGLHAVLSDLIDTVHCHCMGKVFHASHLPYPPHWTWTLSYLRWPVALEVVVDCEIVQLIPKPRLWTARTRMCRSVCGDLVWWSTGWVHHTQDVTQKIFRSCNSWHASAMELTLTMKLAKKPSPCRVSFCCETWWMAVFMLWPSKCY